MSSSQDTLAPHVQFIPLKTWFLTALALFAFAANSVLCRLALAEYQMDAAAFTSVRLLSGAVVLMSILGGFFLFSRQQADEASDIPVKHGSWRAALMLFTYALCFSFAYITLDTGTGALVLFGCVQVTMMLVAVVRGEKISLVEWGGLGLAIVGFVYLVLPSLSSPSFWGFILMVIAGIAWAVYTLMGKGSVLPLADTAYNFVRTLPMVVAFMVVYFALNLEGNMIGALLSLPASAWLMAIASGALASGVGYALWYAVLPSLATTQAAVLQLLVPVLSAIGGVMFAAETFSLHLMIASSLVLGGILVVILAKKYRR